ncbi:MAG: sigma 54-interacting transcriptional regulator [Alphaproteobacteria bacterium]|uniref:Sigma 54-interacting transcriptional regulator n=1 Tax=Candidatus Nitrobium versatile TaxID=2884831 RepID=A0A953J747_9BACT|nr:sigma 54-interacting transcriptional regulator [Candidatus Nitrobium versatile]
MEVKCENTDVFSDTLLKQNKYLSVLYDIALTVSKSLDLKEILKDVLDMIIDFMGVDAGIVFVINDETMEMIPVAFKNIGEEVVKDLLENFVRVGECVCGSIAEYEKEVVILEKASQDPRFTRESSKKAGIEFYAGFPLKAKGKVNGVLCSITYTPYKPDSDQLSTLRAATVPISLAIENSRLFEDAQKKVDAKLRYFIYESIVTNSPKMKEIIRMVRKLTDVLSNILIYGESGTGKELIARTIHLNSLRKEKPFIALNCGAIPESLLESELFGYVKGAFTGANADKKGLFEAANGGTIFLDEVDSMSLNLQVKLLRVLQEKTFVKVGSTQPISLDVKIIAATNRRLEEAIKLKQFREDLFYRLNVVRIELPPLRERVEDISLLARYFISKFNKITGKKIRRISGDALEILNTYLWPGNIRELENAIERAVVMAETDEIKKEDLPLEIVNPPDDSKLDLTLRNIERQHIVKVMSLVDGNKRRAARLLGVDVSTLWRKLKSEGIAFHDTQDA